MQEPPPRTLLNFFRRLVRDGMRFPSPPAKGKAFDANSAAGGVDATGWLWPSERKGLELTPDGVARRADRKKARLLLLNTVFGRAVLPTYGPPTALGCHDVHTVRLARVCQTKSRCTATQSAVLSVGKPLAGAPGRRKNSGLARAGAMIKRRRSTSRQRNWPTPRFGVATFLSGSNAALTARSTRR